MIWITVMLKLLERLSEEEKALFLRKKLEKGNVLFRENERCEFVGIVLSGSLKIVSYLSDGKEIIYNEPQAGQMFGNNLIFSSEPYYKGDIVCQNDAEIDLISKENLLKLLSKNSLFLTDYLKAQSDFTKDLNDKIKLLAISGAEERLLYYLNLHRNQITYDSITSLANTLFLERETLSRTISRMEAKRSISRQGKTITLL